MVSLTSIIGPLVMTNLFAWFTKKDAPVHFSGAPFLLGSVLLMASALVAFYVLKSEKHQPKQALPQYSFEETTEA
jgi:DHA1 family tetracycline resistance protein-like MFS transporter